MISEIDVFKKSNKQEDNISKGAGSVEKYLRKKKFVDP